MFHISEKLIALFLTFIGRKSRFKLLPEDKLPSEEHRLSYIYFLVDSPFIILSKNLIFILVAYLISKDFLQLSVSTEDFWIILPFAILYVDLLKFFTHFLIHRYSWFWKIHITHHTITALEPNAAFRRHFLEYPFYTLILILCNFGICKVLNISILPFVVALQATSMWNLVTHSNIKVHPKITNFFSFVYFPLDHRVHHTPEGTMKNYGVIFNFWDKLIGTYEKSDVPDSELGVSGIMESYPKDYIGQQLYPFRKQKEKSKK